MLEITGLVISFLSYRGQPEGELGDDAGDDKNAEDEWESKRKIIEKLCQYP